MKILMVSMNSLHFIRWTNQLKDAGHEVHWFDIKDGAKIKGLSWVNQINDWKLKYDYPYRYFVKRRLPGLYNFLNRFVGVKPATAFEQELLRIKPDVVHSFALYVSASPILEVMNRHASVKWIYSSWGSDLFYFKEIPKYCRDINKVLARVNYLITDCQRDNKLARTLGFNGRILGTFPAGGGFDYESHQSEIQNPNQRNLILIKGYEGRSGRCINVLKAIKELNDSLSSYSLFVFGADVEVVKFIQTNNLNKDLRLDYSTKENMLAHEEVLKLMGQAMIYIGNSNSDGMPNTLLEAIIMGAFPIQSNPGGSSEDVIEEGKNGLLISDCEDVSEIRLQLERALADEQLRTDAYSINQREIKPKFGREYIKQQVLLAYESAWKEQP